MPDPQIAGSKDSICREAGPHAAIQQNAIFAEPPDWSLAIMQPGVRCPGADFPASS